MIKKKFYKCMDIEWVYVIWEKRSEVKLLKKKKIVGKVIWMS